MANIKKAVEKIEQGDAWEDTDEIVKLEVKKPLDKVIPVRLSADKMNYLRSIFAQNRKSEKLRY